MSLLSDRLLVQLSDPVQLAQLISPASDTTHAQINLLLNAMYDLQFVKIIDVQEVVVRSIELQRLLLANHRTQGTWTQTSPSHTRTDVSYEGAHQVEPFWLDLAVELDLTLMVEVDTGEVASIVQRNTNEFTTFDEFKAAFPFIDLDAFMAEHQIKTIEELRERFQYLSTAIQLRPQEPTDTGVHHYVLRLALLIRETLDVLATLRDIKLVRALQERLISYQTTFEQNTVLSQSAFAVVFPQSVLNGLPFDAVALHKLFASESVLALFVALP